MFRLRLDQILNQPHVLYKLANKIDWHGGRKTIRQPILGRPAKPPDPIDGGVALAEAYLQPGG